MTKLNQLKSNPGAFKVSKRLGRGEGSGKGKTCGSGHKGQGSRTGVALNGFEGGQNPIYRRLPKRGFNNIFRKLIEEVNLGKIQQFIDAGKLDPKKPITKDSLLGAGLIRKVSSPVKLLGNGDIKATISIEVDRASKAAITLVEKVKGSVKLAVLPKD